MIKPILENALSFFKSAKYFLLALIVGIIIGSAVTLYETSVRAKAKQVSVIKEARIDDAKAIDKAFKQDAKLEANKDAIRTQKVYLTKEVIKYVPQTIQDDKSDMACSSPVLNIGAVRLLNAARTGEIVDTTGWVDAEVKAPTEIGLQELSVADTEIATQYRELAKNHDALVDAVTEFRAEQLKRLGAN